MLWELAAYLYIGAKGISDNDAEKKSLWLSVYSIDKQQFNRSLVRAFHQIYEFRREDIKDRN